MTNARNVLEVEFDGLAHEELVQPAIFAQDERIVQTRHQQHILHAERHQVLEALEQVLRVEGRALRDGARRHEFRSAVLQKTAGWKYSTPQSLPVKRFTQDPDRASSWQP